MLARCRYLMKTSHSKGVSYIFMLLYVYFKSYKEMVISVLYDDQVQSQVRKKAEFL